MTDLEVVESLDNAWRALCMQYREYPDQGVQMALNMLSRIINQAEREVRESHREHQITIDEWLSLLND